MEALTIEQAKKYVGKDVQTFGTQGKISKVKLLNYAKDKNMFLAYLDNGAIINLAILEERKMN